MKKKSLYLFIITFSAVVLLLLLLHPFEKKSSASKNVYEKIKDKEAVHYVIIGDSIGRGSGASTKEATWFHLLDQKIKNQYPIPLSRSSVVQSGATAFEGLYKFKNTKIKQADLVFIVFGENDRKYMDNNQFALFYEQLLLEVKTRFPSAELITITESCLENEAFAQTIAAVSKNYLATNIDMRVPFKQSGYSTKELTKDFIHPNDKGYQIYSEEIYSVLKNNLKKNKPTSNIVMDPKKKSSYLLQTKYAF
ncbi:MAG: SGNH/GDSL hydrolase family protein [Bacillus sp. (in: firmicutes)]